MLNLAPDSRDCAPFVAERTTDDNMQFGSIHSNCVGSEVERTECTRSRIKGLFWVLSKVHKWAYVSAKILNPFKHVN